jgi:hypothetical protein
MQKEYRKKVIPYRFDELVNLPVENFSSKVISDRNKRIEEELADIKKVIRFNTPSMIDGVQIDGRNATWNVSKIDDSFIISASVREPRQKEGKLQLFIKRRFEHSYMLYFPHQYVFYVENINGDVLSPYCQTLNHAKSLVLTLLSNIEFIDVLKEGFVENLSFAKIRFGSASRSRLIAFVVLPSKEIFYLSRLTEKQLELLDKYLPHYLEERNSN